MYYKNISKTFVLQEHHHGPNQNSYEFKLHFGNILAFLVIFFKPKRHVKIRSTIRNHLLNTTTHLHKFQYQLFYYSPLQAAVQL